MPVSTSAEVSSVTVRSCRDVIPVFSDTLTGRGGRRVGEGQLESKSYRRRCHVWFLGAFLARILSSDPSLSAAMFMDILK